jgi:hypothetical protein
MSKNPDVLYRCRKTRQRDKVCAHICFAVHVTLIGMNFLLSTCVCLPPRLGADPLTHALSPCRMLMVPPLNLAYCSVVCVCLTMNICYVSLLAPHLQSHLTVKKFPTVWTGLSQRRFKI